MYADIALPAAGWYEMHDLKHHRHAPLHPPVQPGHRSPLGDPHQLGAVQNHCPKISRKWRSTTWGRSKDLVASPLMHDSPGEIAQSDVRDWHKGECEPRPGQTMPSLAVVTRDYPEIYRMMTALGPLAASVGVGFQGRSVESPR